MVTLPPQIISLEQEDDYVNLLVYGMSGAGKTVFAGSARRVLFIAPEDDGTLSAKRQGSKAKKWIVKKWVDLQEAYDWLYDNPDHGFDWISIDSGTEMQAMLLRHILDETVKEKDSRDPDIPAIQDHQKWQNMFIRFVKAFNALPVNVLWTALARNELDQNKEEFLCPDIAGKGYQMAQKFASFMTSYGYLQVTNQKFKNPRAHEEGQPPTVIRKVRQITWEDTGNIRGKDRTNRLAPVTTNMSLEQITQRIFSEPPNGAGGNKAAPAKAQPKAVAPEPNTGQDAEKKAEAEAAMQAVVDAQKAKAAEQEKAKSAEQEKAVSPK